MVFMLLILAYHSVRSVCALEIDPLLSHVVWKIFVLGFLSHEIVVALCEVSN